MIKKICILFALVSLNNCGYVGGSPNDVATASDSSFANLKTSVFESKCVECHSGSAPSGGYDLSSYEGIMSGGRVVPYQPSQSVLVQRLEDGSMPPTGRLSEQEILTIRDWIQEGALQEGSPVVNNPPVVSPTPAPVATATPKPTATATPAPTATPSTATFSYISKNILSSSCTSCHSNFKTYSGTMKYVKAGNASSSSLYSEVNSGSMPRGGSKLSSSQITAIKTWINNGASNN